MAKITDYTTATSFDSGDVLIKDGTNGTKKITADNAAISFEALANVIVNVSGAQPVITVSSNHDYRCGEITGLTITIPTDSQTGIPTDGERFAALIRFSTGSTAPSPFTYTDIMLSGDDVDVQSDTVSGGYFYVLSPQPNRRYTIAMEWDGEYIMGYVKGLEILGGGETS